MRGGLFRNIAVGSTVLWIATFVVVPYLFVLLFSLLAHDPVTTVSFSLRLDGYRDLVSDVFVRVCARSLFLALAATVITLVVSYPFAYFLGSIPERPRKILLLLMIIPFWTSSLIRTYALIILLKANGIVNSLLMAAGLAREPLELLYTQGAVFAGLVYTLLPFMILPIYSSIQKLDWRLVEAARDLGATPLQIFTRIVLPLTMPGILAGSTMVFLPALGLFYIPDFLGGARSMLIGNYIKDQYLVAGNWAAGSAASVVLTLILCLFLYGYYLSAKKARAQGLGEAP